MVRWLAVVMLVLVAGCGDEEATPPEKCNALADLLCQRAIECIADGTTQAECVAALNTTLPCAEADEVSASYDTCMTDLRAVSCATLTANATINLPTTCNSVILFRP